MKKFLLTLFLLISGLYANAAMPVINCENINNKNIEKESFINKITGLGFATEKITETIIEHELNSELNSKLKANIKTFNIKQLKNGEFEALSLKGNKISYKTFTMSNFSACTICNYNKVIYNGKKVYYPTDLPFNYKADITNEDITNAVNSETFQNAISKPVKINGIPMFTLSTPDIEIKQNRIFYSLPVKTFFGKLNLEFNSDIEVKDNTILLTDIKLDFLGPISINIFNNITQEINPLKYQLNSIKGKYCKIYVTKAKISDNIINTEGIFIINKNYDGER